MDNLEEQTNFCLSLDFGDDVGHEDGSLWDDSDHEIEKASDLEREWQRRHDQFHTVCSVTI